MRVLEAVHPLRVIEVKHLSGQHDQQTHGSGGGAQVTEMKPLRNSDGSEWEPVLAGAGAATTGKSIDFVERGENVQSLRVREAAKAAIVSEISDRLVKDPETFQMLLQRGLDWHDEFSTGQRRLLEKGIPESSPEDEKRYVAEERLKLVKEQAEEITQRTLDSWARTASDESVNAIVIQRAAVAEFGLGSESISGISEHAKREGAWSEEAYGEQGSLYRKVLRKMYEYTQEEFAKAGVKEVTVFRGMRLGEESIPKEVLGKWEGPGPRLTAETTLRANPISSYSAARTIAGEFYSQYDGSIDGGGYPVLVATVVPVSRILSTARTGLGCLPEYEYTVLSGPGKASVTAEVGYAFRPRHKPTTL